MAQSAVRCRATLALLLAALVVSPIAVDETLPPTVLAAAATPPSDQAIGASDPTTDGTERYIVEVDGSLDAFVARQEGLGVDVVQEWDNTAAGFAT